MRTGRVPRIRWGEGGLFTNSHDAQTYGCEVRPMIASHSSPAWLSAEHPTFANGKEGYEAAHDLLSRVTDLILKQLDLAEESIAFGAFQRAVSVL